MKKLVLHIGRHKSGTTTLQKFLHSNIELLESCDYHYPEFGKRAYAHHLIGELMSRQNSKTNDAAYIKNYNESSTNFEHELNRVEGSIIISSESFQNCDPIIVQQYFKNFDVTVVVYLREQTSYLMSAYAQRIHATTCDTSLENYYHQVFDTDYFSFLEKWKAVFKSKLKVKIFDRNYLYKGDIVYDFCCDVLGFTAYEVANNYFEQDSNPSLTNKLLAYKLYLNSSEPNLQRTRQPLYSCLAEMSRTDDSGKLRIPHDLATKVINDCKTSNSKVAQQYFSRNQLFDLDRISSDMASNYEISDEEIDKISKNILNLHPQLSTVLPTKVDEHENTNRIESS